MTVKKPNGVIPAATFKCIICFKDTNGVMDEHNPEPYQHYESGRCCTSCNDIYVLPARLVLSGLGENPRDAEAWAIHIRKNPSEILPKRTPNTKGEFKMMTVRQLLGHSNLGTTTEAYEEVDDEEL